MVMTMAARGKRPAAGTRDRRHTPSIQRTRPRNASMGSAEGVPTAATAPNSIKWLYNHVYIYSMLTGIPKVPLPFSWGIAKLCVIHLVLFFFPLNLRATILYFLNFNIICQNPPVDFKKKKWHVHLFTCLLASISWGKSFCSNFFLQVMMCPGKSWSV